MIEPGIKIDDSELQVVLRGIIQRCDDKRAGLEKIGGVVVESVRHNFHVGGRPTKWTPSKRAKADKIPGRTAATLRDTNRLMNSITSSVSADHVLVGTNVVYAATHHYGAKQFSFGTVAAKVSEHTRIARSGKSYKVSAHTRKMRLPWGTIPARPFMLVQDEDIPTIELIMAKHLMQ